MRSIILALCLLPVIFAGTLNKKYQDDAVLDAEPEPEPEPQATADPYDDDASDLEEDLEMEPVKKLLETLFEGERDGRDVDEEDEDESVNSVDEEEEEMEEDTSMGKYIKDTNPSEIERFNDYMDAIYRRMNAALRAKLMDPMVLNLQEKNKKRNSPTKGKRNKRSAVEEEEEEEDDVDRKGKPMAGEKKKVAKKHNKKNKGGKRGKGGHKGKGKGKKGKKEDKKEDKKHKDEVKNKEKLTPEQRATKKAEREKAKEERQKVKEEKNKEKKESKTEGNKKERKQKNLVDAEDKKSKKGKKGHNHGHKHGKKEMHKEGRMDKKGIKKSGKEDKADKVVGTLSGIATLRKEGPVEIFNSEDHKIIHSAFTVGPLTLDVTKTTGRGQERSQKSANAKTAVLKGMMKIKVKADGSAHVKSVVFDKPEKVVVEGSLGLPKRRSDNIVKQSVRSMRSLAAQRVLKMARFVLKSGSTIAQ